MMFQYLSYCIIELKRRGWKDQQGKGLLVYINLLLDNRAKKGPKEDWIKRNIKKVELFIAAISIKQ